MGDITDLFGATISGPIIITGGEGEMVFFNDEGAEIKLAVQNIELSYGREVQIIELPEGASLITISRAQGAVNIGAMLGSDFSTFLSTYGDPCEAPTHNLRLDLVSDIKCEIGDALTILPEASLTLYYPVIKSIGISSKFQGHVIQTGIQIVCRAVGWTEEES